MNDTLAALATFLDGGRVLACLVVAFLFWRLGARARERLYYAFAIAFLLFALSTTTSALWSSPHAEWNAIVFVPRLVGFCAIIAAVVDRNRRPVRARRAPPARGSTPPVEAGAA